MFHEDHLKSHDSVLVPLMYAPTDDRNNLHALSNEAFHSTEK